jgi:crotonobetainyl-CoA:carnitine CoA-transferase CaiB-like acyl-CoA transferase
MFGALAGLRILDLTHFLSGPYGSMLLADLGAETIKIEPPGEGEGTRKLLKDDPYNSYKGMGAYFLTLMRNKKSVAINLKCNEGRGVFYDLVKISDIVFDNFKPGTLEKLGVDFDTLSTYNPRIISCSVTGYGHTGPHRLQPAFDLCVQAMGGGMSMTGERDRKPVRAGIPIGDMGGGIFATIGILAAVYERERTGRGQKVDISMLDVQISLLNYMATIYFLSSLIPKPIGSDHEFHVPYGVFKTKDIYIVLAIVSDNYWEALCEVLELDNFLSNESLKTKAGRVENRALIVETINERLSSRTGDEWLSLLYERGVPASPVNTFDRALTDPQVVARNMVIELETPSGDGIKMPGNPIKMSNHQEDNFTFPPDVGEHTEEVLISLLGYSSEEISTLRQKQAIQ